MSFNTECIHFNPLHHKKKKIPKPIMNQEEVEYIDLFWCNGKKKYIEDCPDPCEIIDQ